MAEKKNVVEEVVDDVMDDPDAPEKGNTTPPQTVKTEPDDDKRDR